MSWKVKNLKLWKSMVNYTLRVRGGSRSDLGIESESVPRKGETVVFDGVFLVVTEVCNVIEINAFGTSLAKIIVLCQEN